ncbi:MAG: hypothetical protein FWF35_02260 [Elusimicrobia bacterium]|nr:hypothetical protein [Elusimicrobiota bacterium]
MISRNLTLFTISHAVIDMVCMWAMFFIFAANPYEGLKFAVIYNFFAFAFQPLVGMFADTVKKPKEITLVGYVLTAAGIMLFPKFNVAGAVIIGIANAMFHVGAGIIVYNLNPNTPKWQGVYISSGGVGLGLGALAAKAGLSNIYFFAALIVLFILTLFIKTPAAAYAVQRAKFNKNIFFGILILVMTAIFIRSLSSFDIGVFVNGAVQKWYLILFVALGKAVGGFVYEKLGLLKGTVLPLILAGVLFLLAEYSFYFAVMSAAIISMTTGVTLYFLFLLMPRRPGLAFGFNCLALFLGLMIFMLAGTMGTIVTISLLVILTLSVFISGGKLNG